VVSGEPLENSVVFFLVFYRCSTVEIYFDQTLLRFQLSFCLNPSTLHHSLRSMYPETTNPEMSRKRTRVDEPSKGEILATQDDDAQQVEAPTSKTAAAKMAATPATATATAPSEIKFYSTKGLYGCFSNFAVYPFQYKGRTWKTTEHYFQAMKFETTSPADVEAVSKCATAFAAACAGRSRARPLRPDWESVKDNVMFDAVREKFSQHEKLRTILLDTGDAVLVEHSKKDRYWGDGGDGTGKNMLGKTLMKVRDLLRTVPRTVLK
jgi:ribA/ribD-fused uncharacterized protein